MDRLTVEERVKIIKFDYKNGDSALSTFRALRADYGRHNRPTEEAISKTLEKFEETESVTDIVRVVHHRNIRSAENVAVVAQNLWACLTAHCGEFCN